MVMRGWELGGGRELGAKGATSRERRMRRRQWLAGRVGGVRLGCLLALVVVAAGIYYGAVIGQMYLRFYQYQDAFKQEVRFAGHHTDVEIKVHLRALADSLQLPDDAQHLFLKRKPHHILIWSEYYDHVELPFLSRDFYFNPHAEGEL